MPLLRTAAATGVTSAWASARPDLQPGASRQPELSRNVHLLALAIGGAITVGLTAGFATGHTPERWTEATLLLELVVVGLAAWINRRGASMLAANLLALSLPLLALALMVLSGQGLRDVVVLALPGSLLLCGLLLERRALVTATLVTVLSIAVVLALERHGVRVPRPPATDHLADFLDATAILLVIAIGVDHLALRLRRDHDRLRSQEAALRLSEERYRLLVELAADAILLVAPDGRLLAANHRAEELTGCTQGELVGMNVCRLFSAAELEERPLRVAEVAAGRIVTMERRLGRRDGSRVPVEMSTRLMPDGSLQTILRDVSARHRAEAERAALEAQLRQAHKLEAVGRLAGGIAHEFNNLLTTITGSTTLALKETQAQAAEGARRWLLEIDKAAWRAAELTRGLLAFGRQQASAPSVVDLRAVLESSRPLLVPLVGASVTLHHVPSGEPCPALVDRALLEQVIVSLAANARDAMPDGGTLTISTGLAPRVATDAGAGAGPFVFLALSDTGQGMSERVKARLFEPFFTTKAAAGTGLGLAMAYGVVRQHGGFIEVDSAPGRGSTFRLLFPRVDGGDAPRQNRLEA
jgi:PAS domain S-box-containing protein